MGKFMFNNCINLVKVVISGGLQKIEQGVFNGCKNIAIITNDLVDTTTDYIALEKTSITEIDDYAFNYCINLTKVIIPSTILRDGNNAFAYNDALEEVVLNCNSNTTLGSYIFAYDTSLRTVTLSNALTVIPQAAFYGCSNLVTIKNSDGEGEVSSGVVYIPSSVTRI